MVGDRDYYWGGRRGNSCPIEASFKFCRMSGCQEFLVARGGCEVVISLDTAELRHDDQPSVKWEVKSCF